MAQGSLTCPACGARLDEDGRFNHVVSAHGREFCSLECADTPPEDWSDGEDDDDDGGEWGSRGSPPDPGREDFHSDG